MHKPNKYGDDLKEIRPIIAKVNKTKMPHTGFEIGRTKVAYRVVYPIFKNEKYLGAIEISFPVQEFMKSFILKFNKLANFQFDKNIIENSVWKDYIKKGYVLSPIYSMYIEKSSVKFLRGYFNNFDSIRPSKQFAKKIVQKSKQNIEHEAIAVYGEELNEIMVLIPIFNHVSNQFIGYFTTRTDGENIALVQRNFWLGFIISSIFTTILLGIIYFIIKRKEDEKIALQEKTLELDKKIEKQNEELKEKNALLEESQDIAKLGAWRLDLISDTLEWSDQVYSIFEIDKEKFGASYEAFLNTIHPEDLELVITPPIKYSNIMI
jgi:PAS domain-containing protein